MEGNTNKRLVSLLLAEGSLTEKQKRKYLDMANEYLEDFSNNLQRSSVELAKHSVKFDADEWMEWQKYPCVYKYLNAFRNETMRRENDKAIISGEGNSAVAIRKMLEKSSDTSNSRFVVFRLPDREKDG